MPANADIHDCPRLHAEKLWVAGLRRIGVQLIRRPNVALAGSKAFNTEGTENHGAARSLRTMPRPVRTARGVTP
jgi:hypothetical protein